MIARLTLYGKVALCGLIGQYNTGLPYALPLAPVLGKRAQLLGLVVYDHEHRMGKSLVVVGPEQA